MATIVPFAIPRRSPTRKPGVAGSASIIIFPGVRYERAKDAGPVRVAAGPGRKRKGKSQ